MPLPPSPIFEDLTKGQTLPSLQKGPMTSLHLMRWSAAIENWHRIHYDTAFATEHEGLPDLLVNGSWKQHVIYQMLKEWAGQTGWVCAVRYQYRALDIRNDILTVGGEIAQLSTAHNFGYVQISLWIQNHRNITSTTGQATVVLPLSGGPPIPYPFPPELCLPRA